MADEIPSEAVVRISPDSAQTDAWALVLEAMGIPHRIESRAAGFAVLVPPKALPKALAALDAQDQEANETPVPDTATDLGRSYVGLAMGATLAAFFLVTGPRHGLDRGGWFQFGSAIADRIVHGEVWRAVTALTLHADWMHVIGNSVAGLVFVGALGRWLGGGLALFVTLLAGVGGNLLTAYIYKHSHSVVGASTSTFGALGVLVGLQLIRRFRMRSVGRFRRGLLAIASGMALLAMLGAGERSDLLAHATGLGAGMVTGAGLGLWMRKPFRWLGQLLFLVLTVGLIVGSWLLAHTYR
jgi:membrane associated rhomboid family serine protease